MRFVRAIAVACAALAACAVPQPPSGGPPDRTPPRVVASVPAPDSTGVAPTSALAVTFSEPMTRTGLERRIRLWPPIEIGRVRWRGRTIEITPYRPLHPDTTYVVEIEAGVRDEHGVASKDPVRFAFATSAHLDTARIEGHVRFRREPSAAVVRAFRLPRDSTFVPRAARADREAVAGDDGAYVLRWLPSDGGRWLVWAFVDRNHDGRPGEREYGATAGDTVVLDAAHPVARGVDIDIVDPTEPGVVRGHVDNRTGIDTIAVTVTMTRAGHDRPDAIRRATPAGDFAFARVAPGTYALAAFLDLAPDSVCGRWPCADDTLHGCAEPCVAPADSVRVAPGDTVRVEPLRLER